MVQKRYCISMENSFTSEPLSSTVRRDRPAILCRLYHGVPACAHGSNELLPEVAHVSLLLRLTKVSINSQVGMYGLLEAPFIAGAGKGMILTGFGSPEDPIMQELINWPWSGKHTDRKWFDQISKGQDCNGH